MALIYDLKGSPQLLIVNTDGSPDRPIDLQGKTPLDVAESFHSRACVALLKGWDRSPSGRPSMRMHTRASSLGYRMSARWAWCLTTRL